MKHVRRWLDGWRPNELGLCYEEHDQVVGAAWARRVEPVLVRLSLGQSVPEVLIAVDPAHRGQGIGQTLMEALIICAEEAGEPALCLSVSDPNDGAVRLYEGVGFVAIGESGPGLTTMVLDIEK